MFTAASRLPLSTKQVIPGGPLMLKPMLKEHLVFLDKGELVLRDLFSLVG